MGGAFGEMQKAGVEYCIRIRGHLPAEWSAWFDGMAIRCQPDQTTTLSGPVRDQAALHGLLLKVRDLGLALVSVNPVEGETSETITDSV